MRDDLKDYVDITDEIAHGDVQYIIDMLEKFKKLGWNRLYWDGYDSSIHLYKSKENKNED